MGKRRSPRQQSIYKREPFDPYPDEDFDEVSLPPGMPSTRRPITAGPRRGRPKRTGKRGRPKKPTTKFYDRYTKPKVAKVKTKRGRGRPKKKKKAQKILTPEEQYKKYKRAFKRAYRFRGKSVQKAYVRKARGAFLGGMGAIPDNVIFKFWLNPSTVALLKGARHYNRTNAEFYNEVYKPLRAQVQAEIIKLAPRDTSELHDALENSMHKSGGSTIENITDVDPFMVLLNTKGVEYARVVNKMPDDWLKHPGTHSYNIGRKGNTLNDPTAETGWFEKILKFARGIAKSLIITFVQVNGFGPSDYHVQGINMTTVKL